MYICAIIHVLDRLALYVLKRHTTFKQTEGKLNRVRWRVRVNVIKILAACTVYNITGWYDNKYKLLS